MLLTVSLPSPAVELSAGAGFQYFDYQEFSTNGSSLNHETGVLPGLTFSIAGHALGLVHTLGLDAWKGSVDYNGQTQAGADLRTDTEQEILELDYRADWRPARSIGGLYGRIGWQNRDRDIQPTATVSGLFERYRWWDLEAGAVLDLYTSERQTAFIELGGLLTTGGTIEVDLQAFGFGEPQLDLGDGAGYSIRAGWRQHVGKQGLLWVALDYSRRDFDRSEDQTIGNGSATITIAEPESVSKKVSLQLRYSHLLKPRRQGK